MREYKATVEFLFLKHLPLPLEDGGEEKVEGFFSTLGATAPDIFSVASLVQAHMELASEAPGRVISLEVQEVLQEDRQQATRADKPTEEVFYSTGKVCYPTKRNSKKWWKFW